MPFPTPQNPMMLAALMQAYGGGMGGVGAQQPSPMGIGGPQLAPPQPRAGSISPTSPLVAPAPPANMAPAGSPFSGINPQQLMQLWKMLKGGGGLSGTSGSGLLGGLGLTNDMGLFAQGGGYSGLLGGTDATGFAVGASGANAADLLGSGAIAM